MAEVEEGSQEMRIAVAEAAVVAASVVALIEAQEMIEVDQALALAGLVTGFAHRVATIILLIAKNATDVAHKNRPVEGLIAAAVADLITMGEGIKKKTIKEAVMCLVVVVVVVETLIIETMNTEIEAEIEIEKGKGKGTEIEIEKGTEIGTETENGIETVIEIEVDMVEVHRETT